MGPRWTSDGHLTELPDGDPNRDPQRRLQTENRDPWPTPDVPPGSPKDPQQTLDKLSTNPRQQTPNQHPTDTYCNAKIKSQLTHVLKTLPVRSRYHRWFQWGREKTSQISESGQPVWYCLWFGNIEATHWSTNYRNSVYQSRHRSGFSTYELAWLT